MSSRTELKLLTLLNVTAIKKPRALDRPGGHRGSPSIQGSANRSPLSTTHGNAEPTPSEPKANGSSGVPNKSPKGSKKPNGTASTGHEPPASSGDDGSTAPPLKKKRKSVVFAGEVGPSGSTYSSPAKSAVNGKGKGKAKEVTAVIGSPMPGSKLKASSVVADGVANGNGVEVEDDEEEEQDNEQKGQEDMFNIHFGPEPAVLNPQNIASVDEGQWTTESGELSGYGKAVTYSPAGSSSKPSKQNRLIPSLASAVESSSLPLLSQAVDHIGTYRDYYLHSMDDEADGSEKALYGDQKEAMRKAIVLHALNHVLKTRRRIIRNNEKLAHPPEGVDAPEPPRDQSFTRPKILLLFPLRSLALHYLTVHFFPLAPPGTQIENLRPFTSSFSLSPDLEDPLASPSALNTYAVDHIVNFQGNSDDNFRFGIKITRKAWRIVMMPANEEKLLDCDFIIASPLGLKMAADREKSTDLLSSIEVCVADGMDVMQMQNWEHVQFIFDHLNKIPDDPHGCDFSRVKPWYLDDQSRYLRQTILLSRYDSPEARSIFNRKCQNLQGKVRLEISGFPGVLDRVKFGVRQTFERIDLEGTKSMDGEAAVSEIETRLQWFTKKTIPSLLKSAMQRQNTLILVPSYFDFVRLTNYLRKNQVLSFAAISEYSSNAEISRARTEFFKGKKPFLILTERFHFYRRYRIRGAKTLVFYSLPDHAQFYSEFLETPFLPSQNKKKQKQKKRKSGEGEDQEEEDQDEDETDPDEIVCRALFSRFDYFKLERIVGTVNAKLMLTKGEPKFQFM